MSIQIVFRLTNLERSTPTALQHTEKEGQIPYDESHKINLKIVPPKTKLPLVLLENSQRQRGGEWTPTEIHPGQVREGGYHYSCPHMGSSDWMTELRHSFLKRLA